MAQALLGAVWGASSPKWGTAITPPKGSQTHSQKVRTRVNTTSSMCQSSAAGRRLPGRPR